MSDEIKKLDQTQLLRALEKSTTLKAAQSGAGKNLNEIGKDEFLRMLVVQLKNQDPLDPMSSDDFAVNLAQFSQLEQLISINQKLDSTSGGDNLGSLAAFLGHEVTLNSNIAQVKNNDGGRVRFQLPREASDVKIELLRVDGSVKETIELGAMSAGRHSVALSDLASASGEYEIRVTAQGLSGENFNVDAFCAGIVTGFIPGADPVLLLGDREVRPADIKEVNRVSG